MQTILIYAKPDIAILGEAIEIIEYTQRKPGGVPETVIYASNPAYDLDE